MTGLSTHRDRIVSDLTDVIRPEIDAYQVGGPYVILATETDLNCHHDFWGMTSPRMARLFQENITDWVGNGPAWIVNDAAILNARGGFVDDAVPLLAAVCCHEMAHCLECPGLCDELKPENAWEHSAYRRVMQKSAPATAEIKTLEQIQHGPDFIRIALHVRYRLQQRDWCVPLNSLLDWREFAKVPAEWHVDELTNEFQDLRHLPLAAVALSRPPTAYSKLFNEELETWKGFKELLQQK